MLAAATPPPRAASGLEGFLNDIATGPDYVGLRYLVAFLITLFATVRVVVPFLADLVRSRNLKTKTLTVDGTPVSFEAAFREVTSRLLNVYADKENCERELRISAQRERVYQRELRRHAVTLPVFDEFGHEKIDDGARAAPPAAPVEDP